MIVERIYIKGKYNNIECMVCVVVVVANRGLEREEDSSETRETARDGLERACAVGLGGRGGGSAA